MLVTGRLAPSGEGSLALAELGFKLLFPKVKAKLTVGNFFPSLAL
jgi:hypothetical protein